MSYIFFWLGIAAAGFGVYEFIDKSITNALLSFILGVLLLTLSNGWKEWD